MPLTASDLRCLVACPGCERQFDAGELAAGSRFHCSCGGVIEVPKFRPHDAEVVRCSSCSAPRAKGSLACAHCGADYTLHEQDLHTICPACMTRLSDRARYCHHCAKPIVAQGAAGKGTKHGCPACGRKHKMISRALGESEVSILECTRCVGVWLCHAGFDRVRDRVREIAAAGPAQTLAAAAAPRPLSGKKQSGLYRRCPMCHTFMNRRNYGGRSGVVVDVCREHGTWFDTRELEAILQWIRAGGAGRSAARNREERPAKERTRRVPLDAGSRAAAPAGFGEQSDLRDAFRGLLGALFDL